MSLKWKLSWVILAAILVTVTIETLASESLNLKIASFGGEAWLVKGHKQTVSALTEDVYVHLELVATMAARGINEHETAQHELATFERDGWFWMIVDGSGRALDQSPTACLELNEDLKLDASPHPRRGSTLCGGNRPALVVSHAVDGAPPAWLIVGRHLDASWLERMSLINGSEATLFNASGQLLSTAHASDGKQIPLTVGSGLERDVFASTEPRFAVSDFNVPGYGGYLLGMNPINVGKSQFVGFSCTGPLGNATHLSVRLMLWVPSESMTAGGYYSKLVSIGTILVLPFLLGFAWFIASRVTRPLAALATAADRFAAGNHDVRAPANLGGEIGTLATAFDKMVASVRDAQSRVVVSEKMAAIGQLAGGVAHEINNPLGVILGFAQGLEQRVKPGDPLRMPVTSIVREALRCKALVQELLVFSRNGKKSVEALDLNALTQSTTMLLEARAKTQGVNVVVDLSSGQLPLSANRTQLQQVIVNLGTNALDAMSGGGTLTLRTRRGSDQMVLEVSDTGEGIDPKLQTRIFEPFFTTREVGKGTGLGLSLVHEIVKQHGGDIRVNSSPGSGTTMRITLPAAPA